jgi:hypothetical protein
LVVRRNIAEAIVNAIMAVAMTANEVGAKPGKLRRNGRRVDRSTRRQAAMAAL